MYDVFHAWVDEVDADRCITHTDTIHTRSLPLTKRFRCRLHYRSIVPGYHCSASFVDFIELACICFAIAHVEWMLFINLTVTTHSPTVLKPNDTSTDLCFHMHLSIHSRLFTYVHLLRLLDIAQSDPLSASSSIFSSRLFHSHDRID